MLTIERLRQVLSYNEETGVFVWLVTRTNSTKMGSVAGSKNSEGYLFITIDRSNYLAHRLAWFFVMGEWPKNQIDHINGDRIDNRLSNLRDVSASFNQHNRPNPSKNNQLRIAGVYRTKYGRFRARLEIGGIKKEIGSFATAEEAHAAYLTAKQKLHLGYVPRAS